LGRPEVREVNPDPPVLPGRPDPTIRSSAAARLRGRRVRAGACLFAFDLLRLNGDDLRPLPLEERRARLRKALRGADKALRFSEHLEGDGEAIFRHACALGLEGIVSKRRDARYRSGRSLTWLKVKNPDYERL
jgi:bifunctional non-homologous end joining protein LigD